MGLRAYVAKREISVDLATRNGHERQRRSVLSEIRHPSSLRRLRNFTTSTTRRLSGIRR